MSVREEKAYLYEKGSLNRLFLPIVKEVSLGDLSQIYFYVRTIRSKNHSIHIGLKTISFSKQPYWEGKRACANHS